MNQTPVYTGQRQFSGVTACQVGTRLSRTTHLTNWVSMKSPTSVLCCYQKHVGC